MMNNGWDFNFTHKNNQGSEKLNNLNKTIEQVVESGLEAAEHNPFQKFHKFSLSINSARHRDVDRNSTEHKTSMPCGSKEPGWFGFSVC